MNNRIVARPRAVHADEPQGFVGHGTHGGDGLDFFIGDARIADDAAGY